MTSAIPPPRRGGGFCERCDTLRNQLFVGTPYDQTLGWMFAKGSEEAYSHLGSDGFTLAGETDEGDLALYRWEGKFIDITFRGTALADQWFSKSGNCIIEKKIVTWIEDCTVEVAGGFHEAYQSLRPHLFHIYKGLGSSCDRVRLMGHSRGAALAKLAALDISCNFKQFEGPIDVVVFAGPRVGDARFKEFYHRRSNIQLVNFELASDPVPKLPLSELDENCMSKLMSRFPRAKEAIKTGFEHIVTPVCLDESWAEPVAIEVVAGVIAGDPARLHTMRSYKKAYKRFFMDPLELARDHRPAIADALKQRILTTFLACRADATLHQLDNVKRQHQNTQEMLSILRADVDCNFKEMQQSINSIQRFLEEDQKATLLASLIRLGAALGRNDIDAEVKQDVRKHSDSVMDVCVRILACQAPQENVVTLLLQAIGNVTRAQIITGQAFDGYFASYFIEFLKFLGPVLDMVLLQAANPDTSNTPLVSAWNSMYRQLSIIAIFSEDASRFKLKLHNEITDRQQDVQFVMAQEGFEAALVEVRSEIKACLANAMDVLRSELVLRANLPQEKQAKIPAILEKQQKRADDLEHDLSEIDKKTQALTIMVAGSISVGKTTFVQSLLQAYSGQVVELPTDRIENTHAVTVLELTETPSDEPDVIAEIIEDGRTLKVKNWTSAKEALNQRIDKPCLDKVKKAKRNASLDNPAAASVVQAIDDSVPVVKIRIYDCEGTLTIVDTPGSDGIGCDYTDFLNDAVLLPVFLCSFQLPKLFDASNLQVLEKLQKLHGPVLPPPVFIFTRHNESQYKPSDDDAEDFDEQQFHRELVALDTLADILISKGTRKPIIGAPNAKAAIRKKSDRCIQEKAKADIKSLCRIFENLGKLYQPVMGYGRSLQLVQEHLSETVNEIFEDDESKAIFSNNVEFTKFKTRVTHDMMAYVDTYLNFFEDCEDRATLVRKLATEPMVPDACRTLIKTEADILKKYNSHIKDDNLPTPWIRKSVYTEKIVKVMADEFQKQVEQDLASKASEILQSQMTRFIETTNMNHERKKTLSLSLPGALAAGLVAGGAAGGLVSGALIWFEVVSISAGPPGWIAALIAGGLALTVTGHSEIGIWSVQEALEQCSNCVIKSLHTDRANMREPIYTACHANLNRLFEDMAKLRQPGDDDFKDNMESVADCAYKLKKFVDKITTRLKSVNFVSPGEEAPTQVLKETKFNNADNW